MENEKMNRRKFLKMIGGGSALIVLGAGCQAVDLSAITALGGTGCKFGLVNDPWPGECRDYIDRNGNGICDYSEIEEDEASASSQQTQAAEIPQNDQAAEVSPTEMPTEAVQPTEAPSSDQAASTNLVVLCNHGCAYPGHCNRYVDADGTGYCDLTEGVPADSAQALTFQTRPSRGGRGK